MELRAEKITCQYHRQGKGTNVFTALQETDLTLSPGKLVEVEGRSGSGKSTLLNIMAGILAPASGKVLLDGQDLYAMSDVELSKTRNLWIGMIPQGQTGLRSLTVFENVLLPSMLYSGKEAGGTARDETHVRKDEKAGQSVSEKSWDIAKNKVFAGTGEKTGQSVSSDPGERANELLEQVGIAHLKDAYPDELSGGELRRMAIARALMMDPGVVLADEPTADLDDENTQIVLTLLRRCADEGKAVLLVTHEREAAAYADVVLRMSDGVLKPVSAEQAG